jgi:hypothetical protein
MVIKERKMIGLQMASTKSNPSIYRRESRLRIESITYLSDLRQADGQARCPSFSFSFSFSFSSTPSPCSDHYPAPYFTPRAARAARLRFDVGGRRRP